MGTKVKRFNVSGQELYVILGPHTRYSNIKGIQRPGLYLINCKSPQ